MATYAVGQDEVSNLPLLLGCMQKGGRHVLPEIQDLRRPYVICQTPDRSSQTPVVGGLDESGKNLLTKRGSKMMHNQVAASYTAWEKGMFHFQDRSGCRRTYQRQWGKSPLCTPHSLVAIFASSQQGVQDKIGERSPCCGSFMCTTSARTRWHGSSRTNQARGRGVYSPEAMIKPGSRIENGPMKNKL